MGIWFLSVVVTEHPPHPPTHTLWLVSSQALLFLSLSLNLLAHYSHAMKLLEVWGVGQDLSQGLKHKSRVRNCPQPILLVTSLQPTSDPQAPLCWWDRISWGDFFPPSLHQPILEPLAMVGPFSKLNSENLAACWNQIHSHSIRLFCFLESSKSRGPQALWRDV